MTGVMPPAPEQIRAIREAADLTQEQAAVLAGLNDRQRWNEYEAGKRRPSAALWELFLLRADQHPTMRLVPRREHR